MRGKDRGGVAQLPDGRLIAYDSNEGGRVSAIWAMAADGTGKHLLTTAKTRATWPAWSPDGRQIAFTTAGEGRPLLAIHRDGSGLRTVLRLSQAPSHDFPSWSPSGDRIAYATDTMDLQTVRPDGSGVRSVLSGVHGGVLFVDFGPAR